ncbi:uncharacterized protein LOC136081303 [Hydra vulgaris]|uniref:Uncharacterized protein LOC136081303 n=1 Tax=Hydra vulgaris TaxID=6087 RepID=A0ABM4BZI7_HYDVU
MVYCCHIWGSSSKVPFFLLDKVQKRIANIVGTALAANLHPSSYRCNVASLPYFYKYYNGHCPKELASLVPSTKIHFRVTRHSIKPHLFSVTVPISSKNAYSSTFFPRTLALWNSLPSFCFPDSFNLQSFKSSINRYLAQQSSSFLFQ